MINMSLKLPVSQQTLIFDGGRRGWHKQIRPRVCSFVSMHLSKRVCVRYAVIGWGRACVCTDANMQVQARVRVRV